MTWILALLLSLQCEISACSSSAESYAADVSYGSAGDVRRDFAVLTALARIRSPRSSEVDAVPILAQSSIRRDLGQRGPSKILINLCQIIAGFG
jgi:hypothetical protein